MGLIITGVLIIVFISVLSNNLRKVRPKISARTPQALTLPAQEVKAIKEEAVKKESTWGRDPFTLQEVSSTGIDTIQGLRLMGVTIGERTKSKAIINNEIVSIGSKIGEFKVLSISQDKVVVSDGEKSFELKMSQ